MAERFYADEVEDYAEQQRLVGNHPNIADANIAFVFRDGTIKRSGEEIMGRATTVPDKYQAVMQKHGPGYDFVIEISFEFWNNCNDEQREAYLDELLCQCVGEMQDDGTMKYKTRNPTINTFPEVIKRHGVKFDPEVQKFANRMGLDYDDDGELEEPSKAEELLGDAE